MINHKTLNLINSPKQKNKSLYVNNDWYHYYAGFSDAFVQELFDLYCPKTKDSVILDPWNGAGTTTLVSSISNYSSYGFDINPVMVIVANAKLYNVNKDYICLNSIFSEKKKVHQNNDDPLSKWFDRQSVNSIRQLEMAIRKLCSMEDSQYIKSLRDYERLSSKICFHYVVFFNLLRRLTSVFVGSNPTWIKSTIDEHKKLSIQYKKLCTLYIEIFNQMNKSNIEIPNETIATIKIANSKDLPITKNSVDFVITSPPYCTRIDYVVYTRVELSLLGYSENDLKLLRKNMIGTPTIALSPFGNTNSKTCDLTLKAIENHESKAAKSYYYKTYTQYFDGINSSVQEISRVLKKNCIAVIVVQDSWFKNIHIDLQKIFTEICSNFQLKLVAKKDVRSPNNMRYINTKSDEYRKEKSNNETVLIYKKVSGKHDN